MRDFVGGKELGLKLLALRRVSDHLRRDRSASGEPVALAAPMTEALSRMVVAHTALLPVNGPDGAIAGSVALSDMVA